LQQQTSKKKHTRNTSETLSGVYQFEICDTQVHTYVV